MSRVIIVLLKSSCLFPSTGLARSRRSTLRSSMSCLHSTTQQCTGSRRISFAMLPRSLPISCTPVSIFYILCDVQNILLSHCADLQMLWVGAASSTLCSTRRRPHHLRVFLSRFCFRKFPSIWAFQNSRLDLCWMMAFCFDCRCHQRKCVRVVTFLVPYVVYRSGSKISFSLTTLRGSFLATIPAIHALQSTSSHRLVLAVLPKVFQDASTTVFFISPPRIIFVNNFVISNPLRTKFWKLDSINIRRHWGLINSRLRRELLLT